MMVRGRDLARLVLVLVEAVSVLVLGVRTAAVTSNCNHYNCDPRCGSWSRHTPRPGPRWSSGSASASSPCPWPPPAHSPAYR